MRPDSSRGPDDRHGTRGGQGLSAASREGQAPESKKGVWISGWRAQGRERGGMQAEALEGQHTTTDPLPKVLLHCPSACSALGTPARKLGTRRQTVPKTRVGEQSVKACGGNKN